MKRFFILLCATLLAAACTVDKSNSSDRNTDNLAALAYTIATWASDGVVSLMNDYALDDKVDVFDPAFDRTVETSHKLGIRITIDPSEDSLWSVSNSDPAGIVRFDAQLKMLPSDKKEKETDTERHRWRYTVVGQYLEPGGMGADFHDDGGFTFYWYPALIDVVNGTYYALTKEGKFRIETFSGAVPLDWLDMRFLGQARGIDYVSGRRD